MAGIDGISVLLKATVGSGDIFVGHGLFFCICVETTILLGFDF